MRTRTYFLLTATLLFLSLTFARAQENEIRLMENWAYKSEQGSYEKLNKMITASNGYIVAVGETVGKSMQDADGLFVVLDPANDGNEITKKVFGNKGDQVFHSVAQNHDGTFTIVGYTTSESSPFKEAWVLQLDVDGEMVGGGKPSVPAGFQSELKDVAVNQNGVVMAVGVRFDKKSGQNWVIQIQGDEFPVNRPIANNELGEAIALTGGQEDDFLLIGNTSSGNRKHPNQIWAMKLNREGNNQWKDPQFYGDKGIQKAAGVTYTPMEGGFAIVGSTRGNTGPENIWLVKITEDGRLAWQKDYGGNASDKGNAVIELSEGGYAILGQSRSQAYKAKYAVPLVIITDEKGTNLEQEQYPIYNSVVDNVGHSISETIDGEGLVISVSTFDPKKQSYPICFLGCIDYKRRPLEDYVPQDDGRFGSDNSRLEVTMPVFVDADGDNYLRATERGYFMIEVTNRTNKNIHNVKGEVFEPEGATGLTFWEEIRVGTVRAGQTKRLFVPVEATEEAPRGPVSLSIDLKVEETFAANQLLSMEDVGREEPANILVETHRFTPGADARPNELILLEVELVNSGMMMSEPMTGYFDVPSGVQIQQSPRIRIPAIRGRGHHTISFPFSYDPDFRSDAIEVRFRADGGNSGSISRTCRVRISPSVAQADPPPSRSGGQSGGRAASVEAWWTSHSTDSKAIEVNSRDVRVKAMVLSNQPLKDGQIGVYVNSKKSFGSKMGESQLRPPSNHSSGMVRHDYITRVKLKPGRNKVQIAFRDEHGNDIDGQSETLIFDFTPPGKPNLHVLAIGVDHHDLDYTVKDARDFALKFQNLDRDKRLFGKVQVYQVTDSEQTTTQNLKMSFVKLQRQKIREDDLTVVFISSHGMRNEMGDFLLAPSDYNPDYKDILTVNFKEDILKKLNTIPGKKLMFIDACHSGTVGGRSYSDKAISKLLNDLMNKTPGLEIFASCGSNEYSYEDDVWQNGAFTEAILEAFENKEVTINGEKMRADRYGHDPDTGERTDEPDGVITIEELREFVRNRVQSLVKRVKDEIQVPINQSEQVLPGDTGIFIVN